MLKLAVFLAAFVAPRRSADATDRDAGATAVEYGLMIALIAAVIVGAVFALGGTVKNSFNKTSNCISAPAGTGATPAPC